MARGSVVKRYWKDRVRFSYAIKYRLPNGRWKWETVGSSKKEAERVLNQRQSELDRGIYSELSATTFERFAEQWLANYARHNMRPITLEGYQCSLRNHLIPALGKYQLKQITPAVLHELQREIRGKGLTARTTNKVMIPLRRMLHHAVQWEYLERNPARAVGQLREEPPKTHPLTPAELERLIKAADPKWRLLFMTAAYTGVREGELLALRWKDIDWTSKRLHVRRSTWRLGFYEPKTKSSIRSVDLMPHLANALYSAKPKDPPAEWDDQLIFGRPNGKPHKPDPVLAQLRSALERAGLPRIRFHDLRHSYASLLIAAEEHPKYVQSQLGHSSIKITMDRYGHLFEDVYGHRGERLERWLRTESDRRAGDS